MLYRSLRACTVESIERRAELLSALKAEYQSLTTSRESLREVQATLNDVHSTLSDRDGSTSDNALRDRLRQSQSTCDEVAEGRQRHIHTQPRPSRSIRDDTTLREYLYEENDSRYPVLQTVADCTASIQACQTQILS
jgi:hypothetical protein